MVDVGTGKVGGWARGRGFVGDADCDDRFDTESLREPQEATDVVLRWASVCVAAVLESAPKM